MDPERASFWVIAEYIDSKADRTVAEPNEPAPILLMCLEVLEVAGDQGKQLVPNHVVSPATLVNVARGVFRGNFLYEAEFVGHADNHMYQSRLFQVAPMRLTLVCYSLYFAERIG